MKTNMKPWIAGLCAFAMILAAGCARKTPDEVAVMVYEAIRDDESGVIKDNCTESTVMFIQMCGSMVDYHGASFRAVDTKIDGDRATVTIEITKKDGRKSTEKLPLVKVGGSWKADVKK